MSLAIIAREFFKLFGLEFRRIRPAHEEIPRLVHFLKEARISTVIDVGANIGQFAESLFRAGYEGRVVSIEPIPSANETARRRSARYGGRWLVLEPVAASSATGTAAFNVSANLVSSSLRKVTSETVEAAEDAALREVISVRTALLDDILDRAGVEAGTLFLKIDTQGAEGDVLAGAARTLMRTGGVKLELSLADLYEGQMSPAQLDEMIRNMGFVCWDLIPGFRNRISGRLLQYDAIYFRRAGVLS